ncbi:hypothetical protein FB00_11245 [Cellulosimicrobium funkei]|uniref:Major capsid protein n=1 Tax=Cellulosimicrobium funkei TaxID=264251 RepID=A0A0H2KM24_9MICO|nr:hypothetical protein [Cellulosimicrobium funkei]KLN34575.1 hypothetical protein FB00_11245 [Cellulosimicrobium funkei]
MTTLKAQGQLITASADSRVVRYLLLPFGETGRTSAGAITASAGSVSWPEDATTLTANLEHDPTRPVGRFVSVEETEEGLTASVRVVANTAGNDLLAEIAEGLRTGISVEIENPVIRAGALLAGDLTGAGFVVTPAFPSAQLVASDCGDLDPSGNPDPASENDPVSVTPEALSAPTSEASADDTNTEQEVNVDNAVAPQELLVASKNVNQDKTDAPVNIKGFAELVASHHKSGQENKLTAALENIGIGDVYDDITQPQFLGELWDGRSFSQRFAPLVSHASLTSRKAVGWKFVETPTVDDYAGFPAEVPTSGVSTESVEVNAQRLAGGWKLDREFVDFGESAFISSFFRHATDDYARKIDAKVLNKISASATVVTGGTVPAGMNATATKIVDGALDLLGQDIVPTFAVVGSDLYRSLLLTPKDNVFEYLSSAFGLESGNSLGFTVVPSSAAALQGKVLVGARESLTLFELPGSPIRVNALDVAHAGIDEALYGYYALLYTGRGIVSVV